MDKKRVQCVAQSVMFTVVLLQLDQLSVTGYKIAGFDFMACVTCKKTEKVNK